MESTPKETIGETACSRQEQIKVILVKLSSVKSSISNYLVRLSSTKRCTCLLYAPAYQNPASITHTDQARRTRDLRVFTFSSF
jgi:hypothetical protein